MKHALAHIGGCIVMILAIILLPALGAGPGLTFTLFVVLMFACHLFMMRGHDHDHPQGTSEPEPHQKG